MTSDLTTLKLLGLVLPLALIASLSCGKDTSASAEASLTSQARLATPRESRTPATTTSVGFTEAEFTRHVTDLKARITKKLSARGPTGFSIIVQKPFVVIGDEPRDVVQERAEGTVKWAVDRLKQDFFVKDPNDILDIWLFKDAASYEKHTQLFFGESPSTPYGYYSPTHKALIMNIGTGGGTLVHELVHPFMEANFPGCPPWFNEGLGSLYEQCGDVGGHIHGFTNWRLPGLQLAIGEKRVPAFKTLMELDRDGFYSDDRGTNYAQSRYLCHYLQEEGLLITFYQEFLKRQKEDPSGFQSLQKVLGETDMDAFKQKWEKYVLALKRE